MTHNGRHSADDRLAIALAGGLTVRDAAAQAGIGERTATRRVADPAFKSRVMAIRTEMLQVAFGKLVSGLTAAVETLVNMLSSADESIRVRAASKLLDVTLQYWEAVDIAPRVAALEKKMNESATQPVAEAA